MKEQQKKIQLRKIREEADAIESGTRRSDVRKFAGKISDRAEMLLEDIEE